MSTPTTNYGWGKPTVGGDNGNWGSLINTALDGVDTTVKAVSDVANAALPKAGGAVTGRADLLTTTFARVDKGSISGAQSLDLGAAQFFTFTINGATTLSISNAAPGTVAQGFIMRITNGGASAITWPASFRFPGGVTPALTAAGVDVLVALSPDNGTTWSVTIAMKDVR